MVRLSVRVLGYTLTIGRDDGTEDQQPGLKPPRGSGVAGAPGTDRPRRATISDRLMKPWPPTLAEAVPRQEQPGAGTFWAALDPGERRDFIAVAQERTFAAGATLMREGESADHVLVVLSGHTKVCVDEDGRELLLGERGPGELIGERAALEVSVRSATVVALDTMRALVAPTRLFAEFVSAHPRVLGLVEGQVYARLTETPDSVLRPRRLNLAGENCTVVLIDVVGFGGQHRSEEDRQFVRQALADMTQSFLDGVGPFCSCEDRGDGFLLIVPPGVPTSRVMKCLLQELPPRLRRHNHRYSTALQIRLRVAATVGPVTSDGMGVTGDAIISAARLVEAPVLKQSMLDRRPNLGLITSEFVHETAIKPTAGDTYFADYEQIQDTVKESSFPAWMKLIDPESADGC
jgi:CRP-like cAMP-binding protein